MTTIRTLTLAFLATLAPLAARAAESPACDHAALARAEASAYTATRVQHECMDPAECRVADELVRASMAQLSAVRRLCDVHAPSQADPFEDATAQTKPDDSDAAWVLTSQIAEQFLTR